MNHISSWDVPSLWISSSVSPNTDSALIGLAQAFPQIPTSIGIDGIQMADHGGLEACRFVNVSMWQFVTGFRARAFRMQTGCTDTELSVSNRPVLGRAFQLDAPASSVVLIGFDDRAFQGTALPFSLPGLTACELRVDPVMTLGTTTGVMSLPIPNDTRAVGFELFLQAGAIANGQVHFSNGVRASLGLR